MKFQLMSRAAIAALAAGAAAPAPEDADAGPEPGQGGSDKPNAAPPADAPDAGKPKDGQQPSDAPAAPDASTAVVAAADATALIAEADAAGFARANARMTAVFASDEGRANPSDAAFLLANSHADANAIIGQLKTRAGGAAPSATAAAAGDKPVIPNTSVNIGVDPTALAGDKGAKAEADEGWDASISQYSAARAPIISRPVAAADGTITVPAVTRTGN